MLEVSDLERSLEFYRDALGLGVAVRWAPPRDAVWLSIGRHAVLGLWPRESGGPGVGIAGARGGSHVHFAVYVERRSLAGWKARLEAAGLQVEGPVAFDHGNESLFVTDPDRNVVELGDWRFDWEGEPVERD